ncbi:MAG: hypothetical protein PSY14_17075 [bacterium]|nr:hypothetical protein [bacterium]
MADADFKRRVEMITAGKADDLQTVNTLLADDTHLSSFSVYLGVMSRENPSAVEKSLNLPNLDRSTGVFRQMMSVVVSNAAYRGDKEFVETLLKYAPLPAAAAQDGLNHMFNAMARDGRDDYSSDVAAVLVRAGANAAQAAAPVEAQLAAQQDAASASLSKLAAFKSSIG